MNIKAAIAPQQWLNSEQVGEYEYLFDGDYNRSAETIDILGKRLAPRTGFSETSVISPKRRSEMGNQKKTPGKPGVGEWSDGESNPDLLNAIQPSSR